MPPYRKSQRGWLTGDSLAPLTGRVLFIPGDLAFQTAVNGALTELGFEWNWEQFGTVTPEAAAQAMRDMLAAYFESEVIVNNTNLILLPSTADVKTGAAFAWIVNTSNELGGYWQQNPGATGDKFAWRQFLAPGQWEYIFSYVRGTANGKADFKIAGVLGGTVENVNFDLRGAALFNARFTGNFTIPGAGGQYDISLEGTGASSGSSYTRPIGRLELWKVDN